MGGPMFQEKSNRSEQSRASSGSKLSKVSQHTAETLKLSGYGVETTANLEQVDNMQAIERHHFKEVSDDVNLTTRYLVGLSTFAWFVVFLLDLIEELLPPSVRILRDLTNPDSIEVRELKWPLNGP